jgi:predicted aconitase
LKTVIKSLFCFDYLRDMAMKLTDHEKDLLDGREGPAAQIALSSLVDLGEAFGAKKLIAVGCPHFSIAEFQLNLPIIGNPRETWMLPTAVWRSVWSPP